MPRELITTEYTIYRADGSDGSADLVPSGDTHGYCGLAGDPKAALQPSRY